MTAAPHPVVRPPPSSLLPPGLQRQAPRLQRRPLRRTSRTPGGRICEPPTHSRRHRTALDFFRREPEQGGANAESPQKLVSPVVPLVFDLGPEPLPRRNGRAGRGYRGAGFIGQGAEQGQRVGVHVIQTGEHGLIPVGQKAAVPGLGRPTTVSAYLNRSMAARSRTRSPGVNMPGRPAHSRSAGGIQAATRRVRYRIRSE